MKQSRALQNITDICSILRTKTGVADHLPNILRNVLSQGFPIRRNFQRMCQPRSNKIASVQWEYLRFVLQSPKRSALYNSMIIFFKFCTQIVRISAAVTPDSVITEKLFPFHPHSFLPADGRSPDFFHAAFHNIIYHPPL